MLTEIFQCSFADACLLIDRRQLGTREPPCRSLPRTLHIVIHYHRSRSAATVSCIGAYASRHLHLPTRKSQVGSTSQSADIVPFPTPSLRSYQTEFAHTGMKCSPGSQTSWRSSRCLASLVKHSCSTFQLPRRHHPRRPPSRLSYRPLQQPTSRGQRSRRTMASSTTPRPQGAWPGAGRCGGPPRTCRQSL